MVVCLHKDSNVSSAESVARTLLARIAPVWLRGISRSGEERSVTISWNGSVIGRLNFHNIGSQDSRFTSIR